MFPFKPISKPPELRTSVYDWEEDKNVTILCFEYGFNENCISGLSQMGLCYEIVDKG